MNLKIRLTVMNFLEFAVWGAILPAWEFIWATLAWVRISEHSMPCKASSLYLCLLLWEL